MTYNLLYTTNCCVLTTHYSPLILTTYDARRTRRMTHDSPTQVRVPFFYMSREVREAHWADLHFASGRTTRPTLTSPLNDSLGNEISPIEVGDIEAAVTGACVERSYVLSAPSPTRPLNPSPLLAFSPALLESPASSAFSPALARTTEGSEESAAPPEPESRVTRI